MSKIIYLGFYATPKSNRYGSLAGTTLIDYVSSSISDMGYKCYIVSPAISDNYHNKEILKIDNNRSLLYLTSYGIAKRWNIIKRYLITLKRKRNLYNELYKIIDDNDILIAYHSLFYIDVLMKLRKNKKFKFILQVCEIYSDVNNNKYQRLKEKKIIHKADSYIFSNNKLNDYFNEQNKPYAICLGTYKTNISLEPKFHDGKIHITYAGTFDILKGGALAAVTSSEFLTSDYHMHILGFGSKKDTEFIIQSIEEVRKKSSCTISFEGCLTGENYIKFIQRCDIGLSTQNPKAAFNETSFPSKILSYMANGLYVVSVRIPVVEDSVIGRDVTYYLNQSPICIADAIKSVNFKANDPRMVLNDIDNDFKKQLKHLIDC